MSLNLPRVQSSVVDRSGLATKEWYEFFRSISSATGIDPELQQIINGLMQRLEQLEKNGGLTFKLEGRDSIEIQGLPSNGYVQLTLANDADQPGNTFVYGTNALGEKGWHMLADGFEVVPESLTKTVDPETNITTYDLAEVTDAGGGQLLKFARDSKGRVTGTSTPTTDDLQEGSTNLYYTDERAQAAVVRQSIISGETTTAPSQEVVHSAINDLLNRISDYLNLHQQNIATEPFLLRRNVSNGYLSFSGGADFYGNARFEIVGPDYPVPYLANCALFYGKEIAFLGPSTGEYCRISALNLNPGNDGGTTLGNPSLRWSVVYAATGAINTSDARDKTETRPFTDPEIEAAKDMAKEVGIYQWLHSIDKKGIQDARHHVGFTVQKAISIMQAHGLDPFEYGFICHDSWDAQEEILEDGKILIPARPEGDRYGFRYDQLNQFLMRGMAARLDAIEATLTALSEKPDSSEPG